MGTTGSGVGGAGVLVGGVLTLAARGEAVVGSSMFSLTVLLLRKATINSLHVHTKVSSRMQRDARTIVRRRLLLPKVRLIRCIGMFTIAYFFSLVGFHHLERFSTY